MPSRALVLGGGGPVGIGWEAGLVAGLAEAGVHLAQADLIVGTSAGSVVGAQLALGREPQSLLAAQLAQGEAAAGGGAGAQPPPDLSPLIALMGRMAAAGARAPRELLAEIGAFALQAQTMDEASFIASFGRWAGRGDDPVGWPANFVCTAVDAHDGSFMTWDKDAGVGLARAVASSCAVPGIFPPITINGRRYMDGGVRSATNADLARGADVVIVVAVTVGAAAGREQLAEAARLRLEQEIAGLREHGSTVELVTPDAASLAAVGPNLMDFRRRAAAARAGLDQGRAEAARLRAAWR